MPGFGRRQLLRNTVCATPGLLLRRASSAPARRPPNIVFVLADDLGWGDLHCYGHAMMQTPNLDRLAREGTLFTQFYVNSPVCSPSRTAFMTGQYPARYAVHGHFADRDHDPKVNQRRGMPDWLDPRATTITRLLQRAGYKTGHFGKWHLGHGPGAPEPGAYGIDTHRTVVSNGPGWADWRTQDFWARSSRLIVDETMQFIENNRDRPFFANVWMLLPHAPLKPTEEQIAPYRGLTPQGLDGNALPYKAAAQVFYASVTDVDQQVGRLLAKLEQLGLARDTLVLFSSDNGPEEIQIRDAGHSGVGSAGPFRGRKRSLYEGGIREPFLVRWPGTVPAGRIDNTSVLSAVDFLPTLCRLTGVEVPSNIELDGEDMHEILQGHSRARRRPLLWEWRFAVFGHVLNRSPILAVRDGEWKLLMNPDRSRVELYDIPRDPSELTNLANREPEVSERLSNMLLKWQLTLPPGPVEPAAGRNDYGWPGATK